MDPHVWGPPMWRLLNHTAWTLDPQHAQVFVHFVSTLSVLLPCRHCRDSFLVFSANAPLTPDDLTSPEVALKWVWFLHDLVNVKLQKPSIPFCKLLDKLTTTAEALSVNDVMFCLRVITDNTSSRWAPPIARAVGRFIGTLTKLLHRGRTGRPDLQHLGQAMQGELARMGRITIGELEAFVVRVANAFEPAYHVHVKDPIGLHCHTTNQMTITALLAQGTHNQDIFDQRIAEVAAGCRLHKESVCKEKCKHLVDRNKMELAEGMQCSPHAFQCLTNS